MKSPHMIVERDRFEAEEELAGQGMLESRFLLAQESSTFSSV